MSLIKCCECNTRVSEYADKCPNCGCPISIIKEKRKNSNRYLITFKGGKTIDLTGIETKITQDDMKSTKLWHILHEEYNAEASISLVIGSMFRFNNYQFPDNYQELYDAMCEYNQKRVEAMDADKLKCPACGSTSVWRVPMALRIISIFSLRRSRTSGGEYECRECGYSWN